jgi:hypothetical protein
MPFEHTLHPSVPIEPAQEEDWGEDWGDVTDATPDINELLETHITDLLVFGQDKDRSACS